MRDLAGFREAVGQYRKQVGRTEKDLADALYLSKGELNKRLHDYHHPQSGRIWRLKPEHVNKIVETLATWGAITARKQALALFAQIDFPSLQEEIDWQASPWNRLHLDALQTERQPPPVHRRLFQAPSLPKEYVHRPAVFDKIKHLLLTQQGQQTTALTTALRGVGGFGKTTLAIALCHDPDIQAAFPDGILWVELGEQPPRPLDVLNGKLREMDKTFSGALTLEEARDRWFMALHESVYLLVIDDVWKIETLKELLQGGPRCKRLVTTRNDLLLPKEIPSQARVVVDAMKHSEAITLLRQDLPEEVFRATYQPKLKALAKRLGFWPLLLTLANGMLTDLVEHHLSIAQALTTLTEAYEALGVTAFRLDNVEERQQTVDACLGVSLRHLETFTHPHYHATQRYQELAVFPEDTDIPLSTLQIYWKGNAGLQPWETKDLCLRLHRLSLLLNCDLGAGTIRLHDVVRSYLIQRTREHLPALHQHLLNAYQQHYYLTSWANLPRSESYLWQHLVSHLCQINHPEVLQTTLIDLLYLARKTLYRGVPELEADLGLASTFSLSTGVGNVSSQLTVLHRTTMRISHFLQQVSSEAEIGSLLLSYLGEHTGWTTPQGALEQELPRPFLAAWHPLPQSPSSALHRTLRGHVDSVNACRFSPNGKFIASASADGTLKVWEVATGAEHLTLSGHTDPVNGCAFSSDGEFVISASADNTLRVWEAATGAEILTLAGHTSWINACTFSPDGKFIVSASRDHTLKVWEATTGAEISTLAGHTKSVNDCAFSPDGKFIVSASDDHTLKVWEAASGTEIRTLAGHTKPVNGCTFSPDGKFIASASWDQTLKVWEAATGAEILTLAGHTEPVSACVFSPDGKFIVSASWDHTLKVWNAATGAEILTLAGHTEPVNACVFSPDGKFIASASADHTLKVWDATTGSEHLVSSGHTDWVYDCAVSPDGKFIASASRDHTLKVWEAATGTEHLTLAGHTKPVHGCAFSPNGKFIVSASWDHTLKVWNAATGAERFTLTGHTDAVNDCAVSPDGKFIVSASWDQTLKVWEAATGMEIRTLAGHTEPVHVCTFSPDGKFIVSAAVSHTLKVWDVATGAERRILSGHTKLVNGCTFSPDGKFIVSASDDHTLKVWEVRTGRDVLTFPVDGALLGCVFHPDGEHLIVCGDTGMYFLRLVQ